MNLTEHFDLKVTICFQGDANVGKTSLITRFSEDNFPDPSIISIGIDFKIRTLQVDDKIIKVYSWEKAGQARFRSMDQAYYQRKEGIILVYAINDRQSFNDISYWVTEVEKYASEDVCIILIGNKSDVGDRCVSYEEGKELADKYGVKFFETSAKDGSNVKEAYDALLREIKEKKSMEGDATDDKREKIKTTKLRFKAEKEGKCF